MTISAKLMKEHRVSSMPNAAVSTVLWGMFDRVMVDVQRTALLRCRYWVWTKTADGESGIHGDHTTRGRAFFVYLCRVGLRALSPASALQAPVSRRHFLIATVMLLMVRRTYIFQRDGLVVIPHPAVPRFDIFFVEGPSATEETTLLYTTNPHCPDCDEQSWQAH